MTTVAEWRDVSRCYGALRAVADVSLALRAGEVTALVGHNGAGKTTLIKLLLGLIRPSAGAVRVLGLDPAGRAGARARQALGFVPENVAFHGAMTALELMAFYARLKNCAPARNLALLERVGLAEAARRRVATYSKGMRQRLGMAQALIGAPRLLLFDEPTSGLDPASRAEVYATIDRLRADGATVLVSTHALAEIERHVDRVAIMHRGRLLALGALAELQRGSALPLRLRVCLRPGGAARVAAVLPPGVSCTPVGDDTTLELVLAPAGKMALLRTLVNLGDAVEDLDWTTPGLEALHRQLVAASAVPEARA
ncbi:MAG TPA: ABC transporter ATP-binding protein [Ottowia sp.]|uniref:ABC transporter ATP-binding protein n=1 Tax=Ottowia sp. TaxID=1898956 RepID=UPI002BB03FDD|nr:ABC transporter ATP-binding protein [Ottowia sp.]HMN21213.1 ABC transporter ATP-binding protein [Ottowia sp.]